MVRTKTLHGSIGSGCPFIAHCLALVGKKRTVVRDQLFPQKPTGSSLWLLRTGVPTPLARRRSSCPPPSPNLARTHLIERCCALPGFPRLRPLPLTFHHRPKDFIKKRRWIANKSNAKTFVNISAYQIGARKRRTWWAPSSTNHTAVASQPINQLNRKDSQLAASSVEAESGPAPAGKTLQRSYPTTRFRRERARNYFEEKNERI